MVEEESEVEPDQNRTRPASVLVAPKTLEGRKRRVAENGLPVLANRPSSYPNPTSSSSSSSSAARKPAVLSKPMLKMTPSAGGGGGRGERERAYSGRQPIERRPQPVREEKPRIPAKPPPPPAIEGASPRATQLLRRLQQQAAASDYYSLLRVDPDATPEDLARARREVTSKLHPDHFTANPKQQARYTW